MSKIIRFHEIGGLEVLRTEDLPLQRRRRFYLDAISHYVRSID